MINDNRLNFPATHRNAGPILEVLRDVLPTEGFVVEVASGSGQHIARFASEFPNLSTSEFRTFYESPFKT